MPDTGSLVVSGTDGMDASTGLRAINTKYALASRESGKVGRERIPASMGLHPVGEIMLGLPK